MEKVFNSDVSNDQIIMILIKKTHKAIFKLISIDDITQHLKLIDQIDIYLKREDIKWVEFIVFDDFEPIVPLNAITYKNKYNNNIICHIEDFQKFYLSNVNDFVRINHIHFDNSKVSSDGWITVTNKRNKKEKYEQIIKELSDLVGDWNKL